MNDAAPQRYATALRMLQVPADVPALGRWLRSPHVSRWWGQQDPEELVLRPRDTDALITVDGEPVGYLCWQKPPAPELERAGLEALPANLADIDILIGEPEFLGRGVGPRALVLLLERLRRDGTDFAGLGTSVSNRAAIRAFGKAGFRPFADFEDPEHGACTYLLKALL